MRPKTGGETIRYSYYSQIFVLRSANRVENEDKIIWFGRVDFAINHVGRCSM